MRKLIHLRDMLINTFFITCGNEITVKCNTIITKKLSSSFCMIKNYEYLNYLCLSYPILKIDLIILHHHVFMLCSKSFKIVKYRL
jgi:hypothetical protein